MSFLSSLLRSSLPLGAIAILGAASCTSILGDDFEIDDEGGDGSGSEGSGTDSSGSGSSAGAACPAAPDDTCGECVCDVCPDEANECVEDEFCAGCLIAGDELACASVDTQLYVDVVSCFFDACSFECGGDSGGGF